MSITEDLGASGFQGGIPGRHITATERRKLLDFTKKVTTYIGEARQHKKRTVLISELLAEALEIQRMILSK